MTDAGFFRGTSAEQDNRFADKQKKLLKSLKFDDSLATKVDMTKVQLDSLKPWIAEKITQFLGLDDELVVDFVSNQLEDTRFPDPKLMQINLTGFLNGRDARIFMGELWSRLASAQNSKGGVPPELLEKKKEEIRKMLAEQRTSTETHGRESSPTRKRSRSRERSDRNRDRRRSRSGSFRNDRDRRVSPHQRPVDSVQNKRSYRSNRDNSGSPRRNERRSPRRDRRRRDDRRSRSRSRDKRDRRSPVRRRSPSPRRRSPRRDSPRRRLASPRRRSPQPRRSPIRRRSPSPPRRRSPDRKVELSRRSRSPLPTRRSRSPLPTRRSRSPPPNRRSRSPPLLSRRSRSPPPNRRSRSPLPNLRSRSPIPTRRSRSPPPNRRSRSPLAIRRSPRKLSPEKFAVDTKKMRTSSYSDDDHPKHGVLEQKDQEDKDCSPCEPPGVSMRSRSPSWHPEPKQERIATNARIKDFDSVLLPPPVASVPLVEESRSPALKSKFKNVAPGSDSEEDSHEDSKKDKKKKKKKKHKKEKKKSKKSKKEKRVKESGSDDDDTDSEEDLERKERILRERALKSMEKHRKDETSSD